MERDFEPRGDCRRYILEKGGKAEILRRETFDELYKKKKFKDGPYADNFGNREGEPYNPFRQAFGKLNDGRIVYCELDKKSNEELKRLLRELRKESLEIII